MVWNLEEGESYVFNLYSGKTYEGKVELIDGDVIVVWDLKIGEVEIKVSDCRFVEPSFKLSELMR